MTDTTETTEMDAAERKALLREAYTKATAALRTKYEDEFRTLYTQNAQALGVDYSPRLNPQQRAELELRTLLAENPWLADKLREQFAPGDDDTA